jgi:hypothetical protein
MWWPVKIWISDFNAVKILEVVVFIHIRMKMRIYIRYYGKNLAEVSISF